MKETSLEEIYITIGHRIKEKRSKHIPPLSQERLAKSIGLSRTSIVNIEKGKQRVLLHTLYDIARALNLSITELLPEDGISKKIKMTSPSEISNKIRKEIEDLLSTINNEKM